MARIRTIKPEFPQSESIGKLSRDARLLFVQLWTIVDDAGRTRAASRMLASLLYPYDDDARSLIDGWLDELAAGNMIRLYEADGSRYLEIVKWLEHQKIDRPSPSKLPEYTQPLARPRDDSRSLDADLVPVPVPVPVPSAPADAARTKSVEKKSRKGNATSLPDHYQIQPQISEYAQQRGFTSSELVREHERFCNHAKQNDRRCVDWIAAERNWLITAAERAGKPMQAGQAADDGLIEVIDDEALTAWDNYRRAKEGRTFPRNARGGWRFPSKYPPGYEPRKGEASPPVIPQLPRMSARP
jgi:hypothetical protein